MGGRTIQELLRELDASPSQAPGSTIALEGGSVWIELPEMVRVPQRTWVYEQYLAASIAAALLLVSTLIVEARGGDTEIYVGLLGAPLTFLIWGVGALVLRRTNQPTPSGGPQTTRTGVLVSTDTVLLRFTDGWESFPRSSVHEVHFIDWSSRHGRAIRAQLEHRRDGRRRRYSFVHREVGAEPWPEEAELVDRVVKAVREAIRESG